MAAVSHAPQRPTGEGLPRPRQPEVGAEVDDEEQPSAPIVLPGHGVKVDAVGQPIAVLEGQAANLLHIGSGCSRLVYILSEIMHCYIYKHAAHINDWRVSKIHTYHALQHYFLYHSVERERRLFEYLESMFFGGYIYYIGAYLYHD